MTNRLTEEDKNVFLEWKATVEEFKERSKEAFGLYNPDSSIYSDDETLAILREFVDKVYSIVLRFSNQLCIQYPEICALRRDIDGLEYMRAQQLSYTVHECVLKLYILGGMCRIPGLGRDRVHTAFQYYQIERCLFTIRRIEEYTEVTLPWQKEYVTLIRLMRNLDEHVFNKAHSDALSYHLATLYYVANEGTELMHVPADMLCYFKDFLSLAKADYYHKI